MFDEHRRPWGRLFYLLASVMVLLTWSSAQTPSTTTINDVVYRADGTLAGGTLLISWPTFSTAAGQAVAAGRKSVTLAEGGVLSVALVPNTGATPPGTFYTVVYQLDDGTVKTEFWVVTTTSPTTIAASTHRAGVRKFCRHDLGHRLLREQGRRFDVGPSAITRRPRGAQPGHDQALRGQRIGGKGGRGRRSCPGRAIG